MSLTSTLWTRYQRIGTAWILTVFQARGEEKGQGLRLLRAQEGSPEEAHRRQEERPYRLQGQGGARPVRLLDVFSTLKDERHGFGEAAMALLF